MSNSAFRPINPESTKSNALTMKLLYAGTANNADAELGPGQAYAAIRETSLSLVANTSKVITVSQDYGITLTGPLSITAMPDQISFGGGYWTINPLVLSGLPSTNATPIPWLVPSTPKLASGSDELTSAVDLMQSFSGL